MKLECYYDYRSPFPYLAIDALAVLAGRHGAPVEWIPIRHPELPSYRDRPMSHSVAKRVAYIATDMQRWARRRGLEVRTPSVLLRHVQSPPTAQVVLGLDHPLDTELALRGAVAARRGGCFDGYHRSIYRALWTDGEDVIRDEIVARAFERAGADEAACLREARADATGGELARLTHEADGRGSSGCRPSSSATRCSGARTDSTSSRRSSSALGARGSDRSRPAGRARAALPPCVDSAKV